MSPKVEMHVSKDFKRSQEEIQDLLKKFMFLENGRDNVVELFGEEWFLDYLEEIVELLKKDYNEFLVYITYVKDKKGNGSINGIANVICKKKSSKRHGKIQFQMEQIKIKYPQIETSMALMEIPEEEKYDLSNTREFFDYMDSKFPQKKSL